MCLNVLSLDKIERSFIDKRAIEWSDLNESMFDVYDSGNDGAYCHSINKRETFVSQKKMSQRFIRALHYRNIGAINHFMSHLVRSLDT